MATILPYRRSSRLHRPTAVAAEPDSLLTGLSVWFSLDETSGSRADSHTSGLSLTDNNSVLYVSGKVGNAADFVSANAEYLSHANNGAFSALSGEDLTIGFWANVDSASSNNVGAAKWLSAANIEWYIYASLGSNSTPLFYFSYSSTGYTSIAPPDALSDGTWHYIICEMDRAGGEIHCSVDNGTRGTASTAGAIDKVNTYAAFEIAKNPYMNGSVDEFAIWKRLLTAGEKARLAAGISYPG